MDFLLSFMEEVNCPKKIKHLIMSFYHPNVIIKSICSTLKLYYLKKFKIKDTQKDGPVKQVRTNNSIIRDKRSPWANTSSSSKCSI